MIHGNGGIMKGETMQVVTISRAYYEELLKYKALYQNEKSHTETLEAIIDRILPECIEIIAKEDEIGVLILGDYETEEHDRDITNNRVSKMDPSERWTQEQRDDIEKAMASIADTIVEQLFSGDCDE